MKSLVAEFDSDAVAARLARQLVSFLGKVAVEFDAAAKAAGEWPEKATPTALAFGKKYGVRWEEPITWGNDRLAGREPEVGTLGSALVLFHDDMAGGFGAELPALLTKAGARVRVAERPPLVYGEVSIRPAARSLVKKLASWFEQRSSGKDLEKWTSPPWSRRSLRFGRAADAAFVLDAAACRFIVPLRPSDFDPLRAALAKVGAAVRVATPADERRLSKRELADAAPAAKVKQASPKARGDAAPAASPAPAKKPPREAIPKHAPVVEYVEGFRCRALFSTGSMLYVARGNELAFGADPRKLTHLAKIGDKESANTVFVDDEELWGAGNRLWRSTNGGKSLAKLTMPRGVDPDFWGKEFRGIAKDASGVVWVGGAWVLTARAGTVVHEKSFGDDARINSVVRTPLGVLLLTLAGMAFLANDGKAERLSIRGKGHLSAACVTPRGTLVVVGSGAKWSAEIYRSEDRGATFKPIRLAKLAPLKAIAVLPDGRLVAGGGTLLLVSTDDGLTWKPVKTPRQPAITFDVLCAHGDAIIGDELRIY